MTLMFDIQTQDNFAESTLIGTADTDRLKGTEKNEQIFGDAGNDILSGGGGNDLLDGGEGIDRVKETADVNFTLEDDRLLGESANGIPLIINELISIERATLIGGESDNIIDASGFTKSGVTLDGKDGFDTLIGTSHNDTLIGGEGNDILNGGEGIDRVKVIADVDMTLADDLLYADWIDQLISIEEATLIGGKSDNHINASDFTLGAVKLDGKAGNDRIVGGLHNDILTGGEGNDILEGGSGIDRVQETANVDFLLTDSQLIGNGIDLLYSIERATLTGGNSNNRLDASDFSLGAVRLNGKGGDDILFGGTDNDRLNGGDGNDILVGGEGKDTLIGGLGRDSFEFYAATQGLDRIRDFSVSEDIIGISAEGFGNIEPTANGFISANQFHLGTGATDANHRFIYNQNNGALFFDSDGTGATAQVKIATLSAGLAMTHMNIVII
jgi:Ca2+-binding RTX toxin-like protein